MFSHFQLTFFKYTKSFLHHLEYEIVEEKIQCNWIRHTHLRRRDDSIAKQVLRPQVAAIRHIFVLRRKSAEKNSASAAKFYESFSRRIICGYNSAA